MLQAIAIPAEAVAYLANLAATVFLVCGVGLLAARACRRGSAPLRHGILVWTLVLALASPAAVWLVGRSGWTLVRVTLSSPSDGDCPDFRPSENGTVPLADAVPPIDVFATAPTPDAALPSTPIIPSATESASSETPRQSDVESAVPVVSIAARPAWWQILAGVAAAVWAVGIAIGLLRTALGCVALARFCRGLDAGLSPPARLLVHRAADGLGLRTLPRVYCSKATGVPVSLGPLWPSIVLPEAMTRAPDAAQFEAVLLHEMAHIACRDHWVGVAQRVAAVLFWWNPLVHSISSDISDLREEICDNHVIEVQGEGEPLARGLVDVASRVTARELVPATVGVLEPKLAGLTARVNRLLNKERNMETRMTPRSKLLVLVCGLLLLAAMTTLGGMRLAVAQTTESGSPDDAAIRTPQERSTTAPAANVGLTSLSSADDNVLANSDMERGNTAPDAWRQGAAIPGVRYSWDKRTAFKGNASLAINKTANRYFPIAQWFQMIDREGNVPVLEVSAQVKAEKTTKAILDVIFYDANEKWISHKWAAYIGAKQAGDPPANHDWREYSGRVEIPNGTVKICVALQDYGPGKVWFDDVRASYVSEMGEDADEGASSASTASDDPFAAPQKVLSHVGESASDKRSFADSGFAVEFEGPEGARSVSAVQLFGSRYGLDAPPAEDFHIYLLDEKQKVLEEIRVPYAKVAKTEDMRWHTFDFPPVAVSKKFFVALWFNAEERKGVYVGMDKNIQQSHSWVGLPDRGFQKVEERYDWMIRAVVSGEEGRKPSYPTVVTYPEEKAADTESSEAAPMRTWSDSSGAFQIDAAMVGVADGKVKLKKSDGKVVEVPLDRLSKADQVVVAEQTRPQAQPGAAARSKPVELALDDGRPAGVRSIAGGGHAVRFAVDGDSWYVTSISLYGQRYGTPQPPKEDFDVWICDAEFKPIATFHFPYSSYTRQAARWKSFRIRPTKVPSEFIVSFGFNAEATKGVYVSYDAKASGGSLVGVPGRGEPRPFAEGDWLIRCKVEERVEK